jgi:hypothetical protein
MAVISLLTIMMQFLPAVIITLIYGFLFQSKRNRWIEALIALMYVRALTYNIFAIYRGTAVVGFNPEISFEELGFVLFTDFFFQFASGLQEFLTWTMVSFFAVLFGMAILALKLTLQDPLKMKFQNVIRRITGSPPHSDGFSGFKDRVKNVQFTEEDANPLDPEVISRAYGSAWKDYLIIGLVTLLPSIPIYMSSYPSYYLYSIYVFLIWIYRFGYPASNRIAKDAGLTLGDRKLGEEMMRGVLGWFFKLNLLWSIYTIVSDVYFRLQEGAFNLTQFIDYYILGIELALPPIIFAIIVLPVVEDFAVAFYKTCFLTLAGRKSELPSSESGSFVSKFIAPLATGVVVLAAFLGAVWATTLNFSYYRLSQFFIYPGQVDEFVLNMVQAIHENFSLFQPINWTILMLAIPFGMAIFTGVLGHFVRDHFGGGFVSFAVISGVTVSVPVWFLLPGMDYVLSSRVVPAAIEGEVWLRVIPQIIIPKDPDLIFRIIAQYLVNVPLFIFTILFILYFFDYRQKWKQATGEVGGPLLNVHARDLRDAFVLFFLGIIGSIAGVYILSIFIDVGPLQVMITQLIEEIGNPNGLELVFAVNLGEFATIAEHNVVRTLLMLLIGPMFWSVVLWLVAVPDKKSSEKSIAWASIALIIIAGIMSFLWTEADLARGAFDPGAFPWTYAAQLGYRALFVYGALFIVFMLIAAVKQSSSSGLGIWWLPPIVTFMAIEYFIYDDQFTLIAIIILPLLLAIPYNLIFRPKIGDTSTYTPTYPDEDILDDLLSDEETSTPKATSSTRYEDILITYIRFSLMALSIAEVLSTALWIAGIGTIISIGGNAIHYLAAILPHAIVEIPAFLFATAVSIRVARDLAPNIQKEDWASIPAKTKELLFDGRTWRTYIFVLFFLLLGALIEVNITPIIEELVWRMYP